LKPESGTVQEVSEGAGLDVPFHREFCCAIVIDTDGRFLCQQRDNIPTIVLPGMICLFGGHREPGEAANDCIARELHEELSYFIAPERIEHLGTHRGLDIDRGHGTAHCEYYLVRDICVDKVVVTEGSLRIVRPEEWDALRPRLAPIAQQGMHLFQERQRTRAQPGNATQL
jgi:8-oxo-dGTP pyrophosphatase MutT (NUDIX family)